MLIVHIVGAVLTAVVAIHACVSMVRGGTENYRRAAQLLATLAAFEVATGTALAVLSPTVSAVSVCGNIALYLASVAVIQILLFMRMRRSTLRFPAVQTFSSAFGTLSLLGAAVLLGF